MLLAVLKQLLELPASQCLKAVRPVASFVGKGSPQHCTASLWPSCSTSFGAWSSRYSTETDLEPSAKSSEASTAVRDDRFLFGARKVANLRGRRGAGAAPTLHGIVHINNSSNNIILTLTDANGAVKAWTSAGTAGFKNARKSLPLAAERAADELAKRALKLGYGTATVKLTGVGNNKQYAVQSLNAAGLQLTRLMDITPIAYNGCRRPKKRRV